MISNKIITNIKTNKENNNYFDSLHAKLFINKSSEEIADVTDFLINFLKLDKESRVLQQYSSIGQLAIFLALQNINILGIEDNKSYYNIANTNLEKELQFNCISRNNKTKFNIEFINEKINSYQSSNLFSHIIHWDGNFGQYFHKENINILKSAYNNLNQNGIYLLETSNYINFINHLTPELEFEKNDSKSKYEIKVRSHLNIENSLLTKIWEYKQNNYYLNQINQNNILYTPNQIKELLNNIGFRDVSCYGDYGKELTLDSNRLIIVATK